MMVSLDFWFAVAYACGIVGIYFRAQRFQWLWATVLLWLGVRHWVHACCPECGAYAYGLVHPPFYLTSPVFLLIDDCSKTEDKSFGRQANMPV